MPDINLLPDDFRKREEKERAHSANRPKIFNVEMSRPLEEKRANLNSDKPKKSWWSKIFGQPVSPIRNGVAPIRALESQFERKEEIKKPPEKKIEMKKMRPKKHFWRGIFGRREKLSKPIAFAKPAWVKPPVAPRVFRPSFVPELSGLEKKRENLPPLMSKKKEKKPWFFFGFGGKKAKPEKPIISAGEEKKEMADSPVVAPKTNKLKFNINLIPQELISIKYYDPRWQGIIILIAIISAGLVVFGLYFLIDFGQTDINKKIAASENTVKRLNKELVEYQKQYDRYIGLETKILLIDQLFKNHIYWTKFFNLLEKYTLDGVYFTDVSADASGNLVLPARADNYERVAEQLVALRNATDFIKKATVDEVKLEVSPKSGIVGVSFDLKLKLVDDVFKK
ncbi:MAG: hypothetical protein AAB358_01165 [Patescibacteria group bacterium]